jgi:hypothetical protein
MTSTFIFERKIQQSNDEMKQLELTKEAARVVRFKLMK